MEKKVNSRHLTEEEVEVLALRAVRRRPYNASMRCFDCFIQGFQTATEDEKKDFASFLEREAEYYAKEYEERRRESCAYIGQPMTTEILAEFKAASLLSEKLKEAAVLMRQYKIL